MYRSGIRTCTLFSWYSIHALCLPGKSKDKGLKTLSTILGTRLWRTAVHSLLHAHTSCKHYLLQVMNRTILKALNTSHTLIPVVSILSLLRVILKAPVSAYLECKIICKIKGAPFHGAKRAPPTYLDSVHIQSLKAFNYITDCIQKCDKQRDKEAP